MCHTVWLYFSLQGYGTHFYGPDEYYEGEWYGDMRSGWGRMYYTDGSVYEGEWYDDKRNGRGLLRMGEVEVNGSKMVSNYTCTICNLAAPLQAM